MDWGYQRDLGEERFAPSPFGRASLTVRLRPSKFLPSRALIAALPSATLLMVTKANPRDLPVMRSVTRCTSVTVPYCANRSFRSGSVVLNERFPTYKFIFSRSNECQLQSRSQEPGFKSSLRRHST